MLNLTELNTKIVTTYLNTQTYLIEYKCLCCNKDYQQNV